MNHFIHIIQLRLVVFVFSLNFSKRCQNNLCINFLSGNFWQFEAGDASKGEEHKHFNNIFDNLIFINPYKFCEKKNRAKCTQTKQCAQ